MKLGIPKEHGVLLNTHNDIKLCMFTGHIMSLVDTAMSGSHPHLCVVTGGGWQLLVEPWRAIEGIASVKRDVMDIQIHYQGSTIKQAEL